MVMWTLSCLATGSLQLVATDFQHPSQFAAHCSTTEAIQILCSQINDFIYPGSVCLAGFPSLQTIIYFTLKRNLFFFIIRKGFYSLNLNHEISLTGLMSQCQGAHVTSSPWTFPALALPKRNTLVAVHSSVFPTTLAKHRHNSNITFTGIIEESPIFS